MSETPTIEAKPRSALRKENKNLRRAGLIPLNMYGKGIESVPLEVDEKTFRHTLAHATASSLFRIVVDGKTSNVMLRNIQKHPVTGNVVHVDLLQVNMAQLMRMRLPVVFTGEAPAVKLKTGILQHLVDGLNVEGLPNDLPHNIAVDVSGLTEVDQGILVKDIAMAVGSNFRFLDDPEEMVVKIQATRGVEAEEGGRRRRGCPRIRTSRRVAD